jgi:hypothetical protein
MKIAAKKHKEGVSHKKTHKTQRKKLFLSRILNLLLGLEAGALSFIKPRRHAKNRRKKTSVSIRGKKIKNRISDRWSIFLYF